MERKLKPKAKETFFTPKSDSTAQQCAGGRATRLRERGRRSPAAGPTPEAVGEGPQRVEYDMWRSNPLWSWQAESRATPADSVWRSMTVRDLHSSELSRGQLVVENATVCFRRHEEPWPHSLMPIHASAQQPHCRKEPRASRIGSHKPG
jgi:hypothetical protein